MLIEFALLLSYCNSLQLSDWSVTRPLTNNNNNAILGGLRGSVHLHIIRGGTKAVAMIL